MKTTKGKPANKKLTTTAIGAIKHMAKMDGKVCAASTLEELDPESDIVKTIMDLKRKCFTMKQIGKRIHKSDHYVRWVLQKTGNWFLGVWQVKNLRAQGLGIKAIAKRLKISDKIVSRVVHTHCSKKD